MTKPQAHAACVALGIDLQAMFDLFNGNPANASNATAPDAEDDAPNAALTAHVMSGAPLFPEDEETMNATDDDAPSYEGLDIDQVIAETLAGASVHMTPHLASIMPQMLRPLAEAAVKGPRIVKETVTVQVGEDGAVVTPVFVAPQVNVTKRVPLYVAFGVRKSDGPSAYRFALENTMTGICDYAGAPDVDPHYVWSIEALCDLATQDASGLNAWVYGPAGVGKTAGIEQYAARLGRPFVRIAIDRTTEHADLIGQSVPAKGGGMKWEDGKLTRAFRIPHAVILIDEPSLLRSGTLATIQTALDHRALFLVTGETVRAAPGVFIVAADNTAGCGDDSGRYIDTAPLNAAFMDRFALKTPMGFLPIGQETTMIAARAGIHTAAARIMVEYAHSTRVNADGGHLTMGVTPRRLVAWAKAVKAGLPSAKAWTSVVITGAAPEDREKLIALESTDLRGKHPQIDGIVRGTIDPDAPASDPKTQGGIGATAMQFPDDNEGNA
jgi:MoxR-like ATPase